MKVSYSSGKKPFQFYADTIEIKDPKLGQSEDGNLRIKYPTRRASLASNLYLINSSNSLDIKTIQIILED